MSHVSFVIHPALNRQRVERAQSLNHFNAVVVEARVRVRSLRKQILRNAENEYEKWRAKRLPNMTGEETLLKLYVTLDPLQLVGAGATWN